MILARTAWITAVVALIAVLWGRSASTAQNKAALRELASEGWGTLRGKVVYDGAPPAIGDHRNAMAAHPDAKLMLAGSEAEIMHQHWVVDQKTRAVANVVVWLVPPAGTYFPIHADDRQRKDAVIIDQPHGAFVPHVAVLFPSYFDGAEQKKSGQVCKIVNTSPIARGVWGTSKSKFIAPFAIMVASGKEFFPMIRPASDPVRLSDAYRPWMSAWVWAFDHPYAAVTKKDGSFLIPRVPAGVQASLVAWHEEAGFVFGKEGKKVGLTKENSFDFKIKASNQRKARSAS